MVVGAESQGKGCSVMLLSRTAIRWGAFLFRCHLRRTPLISTLGVQDEQEIIIFQDAIH